MLKVEHLTVKFGDNIIVNDLSFAMEQGEILGIVGESGSGKTMTALGIMDLLPKGASLSGKISLGRMDLTGLPEAEKKNYKGKDIGMVFQEPMTSLNPVISIGRQLDEMLVLHTSLFREERRARIREALETVELSDLLYHKYPHELSGGMQQRVMIAMALICAPKLIIADEPTTALDVEVQGQILQLFKNINQEKHTSLLLISHDLQVIGEICSRVIVMQGGVAVETGKVSDVWEHPEDSYTKNLIAAASICSKQEIFGGGMENILELKNLSVYYTQKSKSLFGKRKKKFILQDFNLEIKKGEILGIVGKSGSGKTTLSKAILGLHNEYTGTITHYSRMPQMIFQDAYSSLNPVKSIGWILEEPLRIRRKFSKRDRRAYVVRMLEKVGLSEGYMDRYPHELSGGQRQRVSIASALMLGSEFIIADEPVSALDVTIQGQILDLLLNLQKEYNLSILFISHDIHVMNRVCDRIIKI